MARNCRRQVTFVLGKRRKKIISYLPSAERFKYNGYFRLMSYIFLEKKGLTTFTLQTKTNSFANKVDPDETARNEPSHLDLHCLPLCWFGYMYSWLSLLAIMKLSKFKVRRAHFKNLGMKGLALNAITVLTFNMKNYVSKKNEARIISLLVVVCYFRRWSNIKSTDL